MLDEHAENHSHPDPRVCLAAERTLLAWVRTGLAMMGFGFVVARLGVSLRELTVVHPTSPPQQGFPVWFGTSLVLLGVVVSFGAAINHWHTIRRLKKGQPLRFHAASSGVIVALLLVILGVMMAVYLYNG